jgi:glycosyltransferase involved in cell wall biosynthesis
MNVYVSIPAYNEGESIAKIVTSIKNVMHKQKDPYTIIVVNDGSSDNTVQEAKKAGALVHSHPKNYGLAETFRTEIKEFLSSKADIFVHIDADGQYNPEDIPNLIKEIKNGYDLVLGSRFLGNIEYMPFMKRLGNKAFALVLSRLTKMKLTDTTTGFRAFTRKVAEQIPITNTFTYTQEQIIRATREKFAIKEIPVNTNKTRESRLFNSSFEYAIKAWINILRIYRDYEPLKFFGKIGISFITLGTIIGLWLVYLFLTTGKVGHTPLAIFTILLLMIGLQVILFGFLADMRRK